MEWQFNPYAVPLFVGVIPMFGLAGFAWQRRSRQAAQFFIIFTLAVAGFMIAYGLELLSANLSMMLTWLKFEYVFSLSLPVIFLLFVMAYNGYDSWLTRQRIVLLLIIPLIHLAAVWTNEFHGLNWQRVGIRYLGDLALFERSYGPMFWIGTIYLYIIAAIASAVLVVSIARYPELYRGQTIPLILAVTSVWVSHILTVTGLSFVSPLDLTPFGYGLTSFLFAWSLFRYKLFDIMPAAQGTILRGMSDAVIVLDAQNRVIDLNPVAQKLSLQSPAQAIGQSATSVFARAPELVALFNNITNLQSEVTLRANGHSQYFDLRLSPLRDERSRLIGRVVMLHDITRLKEAEAAVRKYADELEERNSELDAFGHTIAHDLKTPLTAIMGYAEMLKERYESQLDPNADKILDGIVSAASKMDEMTGELLRLASVRDVGSVITMVDMNVVVDSAVQRLAIDLDKRGIHIDVMPNLPSAMGHAPWIEEVFVNLINNAIKYIGKDNAAPRIAVRGMVQDKVARYEVQDNGLGIAPEQQAHLFEMFARFHQGEARGLGLGLSIVLRIVKRLNGQVGVESAPGQGSTFWFTLPAVNTPPVHPVAPEALTAS